MVRLPGDIEPTRTHTQYNVRPWNPDNKWGGFRKAVRWMFKELPYNPGYEIYARYQSLKDPRVVKQLDIDYAVNLPKIIWMYWDSGEENAPFLVKRCIDSWRAKNPEWELRVLTPDTMPEPGYMDDFPDFLPQRSYANLLRTRLMRDFGGVWADATMYCHRPLDDWLPMFVSTGFCALRNDGRDRWFSSSFLASMPNHPIFAAQAERFSKYCNRLSYTPDIYFVYFYNLQWMLLRNRKLKQMWDLASQLSARQTNFMLAVLNNGIAEERFHEVLRIGAPMSKLNWRIDMDEKDFDELCERAEATLAEIEAERRRT